MAGLEASVVIDDVGNEVPSDAAQMHALVTADVCCQIFDLAQTWIAFKCNVRVWVLIQLLSSRCLACLRLRVWRLDDRLDWARGLQKLVVVEVVHKVLLA